MDATKYRGANNALNGKTMTEMQLPEMDVKILTSFEKQFKDGDALVLGVQDIKTTVEYSLSLNVTKTNVLCDKFGSDTDNWIGEVIKLKLGETEYAQKPVPCVDIV